MLKKNLLVGIIATSSIAINAQNITGSLAAYPSNTIYLQQLKEGSFINLDSAITDSKGGFKFQYTADKKDLYYLRIKTTNTAPNGKAIEPLRVIVEKNDKLQITAKTANPIQEYKISPSKEENTLLRKYVTQFVQRNNTLDSLTKLKTKDQEEAKQIDQFYFDYLVKQIKEVKKDIDANPTLLANVFASNLVLVTTQNGPAMTQPDQDIPYLKKINTVLAAYPYSTVAQNVVRSNKVQIPVAIGEEAPEIALPSPDGKIISTKDFKGKVLLLDFWASWCGPCRAENPNVKKVYEKYHEKGLEILGVSLDKSKDAWVAAIAKDGLNWNHISDLKQWQTIATSLYKFNSIPYTVLIDRKGNIVATKLRGAELETKIAELINQ